MKMIFAVVCFAMVGFGSFAMAGDVVEVRVMASTQAVSPTTQPAATAEPTAAIEVPQDAKVLLSVEALADGGGDFDAKCAVDGKTIHLNGHIRVATDGMRRVEIKFSHREPVWGCEELTTNVMLAIDDQKVIGGVIGGADGRRLIVATIKPRARTAGGKAK